MTVSSPSLHSASLCYATCVITKGPELSVSHICSHTTRRSALTWCPSAPGGHVNTLCYQCVHFNLWNMYSILCYLRLIISFNSCVKFNTFSPRLHIGVVTEQSAVLSLSGNEFTDIPKIVDSKSVNSAFGSAAMHSAPLTFNNFKVQITLSNMGQS